MKLLIAIITLFVILMGCADKRENVSANNLSPSTTDTASPGTATPTQSPTLSQTTTTERPVDFTYLGATENRERVQYRIKVNTAQPISQVEIGVKYMDDGGKLIEEKTSVWPSGGRSRRTPIERGKTYDVVEILPVGATKAEMVLKRVVFENNTYWNAK